VFLTGHTGFKGGWLALWLRQLGAQVTGYARPPAAQPNLYEVARVGERLRSHFGDLADLPQLTGSVQQAQPEIVLHLAAQPLVRASYRDPVETYRTNVLGTVHLLEAVRATPGVKAVVVVTTDKCYEPVDAPSGYRESDRLGGHDPYATSKACAELVTGSYRNAFFAPERLREHGVAIATARAGNVVGGGDWNADRLVPDLVRATELQRPALIRRPDAVRPWQHVLEPLNGYLTLAQGLFEDGARYAEAWNFGPGAEGERSVKWIADRFVAAWGPPAAWQADDPDAQHPHESHLLKLDCAKARERLRWRPRLDLGTGIDWTVQWHRHHLGGADMTAICERQIADYEARA
jgi:CDP-glucose 4,6-dehydratase